MIDDISLNKAAIIRRCLNRISEEYRDDPGRLDDLTIQDSIVLNLLRACEAAIDLAMHRVARGALESLKSAATPSSCYLKTPSSANPAPTP